ncbi:carboxypeptidase-like regulatory domain-containing protein [Solirubrobacter deserti]|uniref:Carboxypeptidase-like regulatory domain-containing protein n=1 Tax=Solirubrobacter deserti TaxID=2282478 RepID=A0ABT4RQC3_9ACTN|nr:carboxypeptidase-like regulatory domain-containing protein [Solirubrobacter deserti]MDA0140744.1 carboxypeptidase-like regulatory domain-containing protein [Solirubrobacter deserti]
MIAAVTLGVSGAAHAGTYVVEACRTGSGPAATDSWTASSIPEGVAEDVVIDGCDRGQQLTFELFNEALQGVRLSFRAPAGTTVAGVTLVRSGAALFGQPATYRLRAGQQTLEQSPDEPEWQLLPGPFTASGLRASGLDVEYLCGGESCAGDARFLSIERAAVTVSDEVAPELTGLPAGRLVAGRMQDGIVDLKLGFKDVGGGVQAIEYKVDGAVRFIENVGGLSCRTPYVVVTPCASEGYATLMLDTDELSDGPHTVEAVLVDVAGNRTIAGPFGISVRTPPPGPPTVVSAPPQAPDLVAAPPAPLRPGVLTLAGARTRRTAYQAVTLKGSVAAPDKAALANATVTLTSRPLHTQAWSGPTTTTTDAEGRFELAVPPGPSRELKLAYGDSTQTVKLVVTAPVRLKTDRKRTHNGRSVRFEGSVPGAGTATTRVELQAWAGRKWVPFRTTALRNGTFKASYRFTSTFRTTRYRFRAVVHESGDFPYASGKSPVVDVVVRP